MARLAVYGAVSTILAGGVIATAFAQRSNFYAACIYLYRSNACMMILLNLGLFLTIIAGQLVQLIFFGNLRTLEVEHLYERAWYAITETCLAMTIFKDEFDTRFVVMFTLLLFLKVFHWLCMDRVDSMEQSPEIPISFHVRMVTMIAMLVSLDVLLVFHAVSMVTLRGPNMMIMFGFEYTLLATSLLASFGKYVLHTIDMRTEEPWENKSMLLFYLDLVADFVKLVTYLLFFMVILVCYGLPLHIIRDVYMTMRSFLQKCKDLIQYRKATRNMNERYPDASPAELAGLSDPICIICREEMVGHHAHGAGTAPAQVAEDVNGVAAQPAQPATPRSSGSNTNVPKKLPCGHIFHFHCLKSWLERQQSCPTCRRLVLDPPTPTSTPIPAAARDAAQGAGAAVAPGVGVAQQGGPVPGGLGNFAQNNVAQAPGAHGVNPAGLLPNQGIGGYPLFGPQGHYPMAGWHPHAVAGGFPGAMPQAGGAGINGSGDTATTATDAPAGTGVHTEPMGQANYIPHYSIPNVMHPIPGFIPLFPVAGAAGAGQHYQQRQASTSPGAQQRDPGSVSGSGGPSHSPAAPLLTSTSSSRSMQFGSAEAVATSSQIPLTPLDALSEEQLKYLEENTRRGLQERLRVLQAVEVQIAQSVSALNKVLGVLPLEGISFRSETADPPSPTMPAPVATPAAASGPSSAMSRIFGTRIGLSASNNGGVTANVGLQPVSGVRSEGVMSDGEGRSDMAATTSTGVSSSTTNGVPSPTSSSPTLSSNVSVPGQSGFTEVQVPGAVNETVPVNAHISEVSDGPLVVESMVTSDGGHERQESETGRLDKGKGKKSDSEIEQEALMITQSESGSNGLYEDEDEDSICSPQEMVRRRWTRVNT
ncbi:E3 ubiquitin-protein ligase hrd1 [Mortierella claussenii]|nr:E3 ubiquitin-protein ligase hrd1 [Mortierella claussenii]